MCEDKVRSPENFKKNIKDFKILKKRRKTKLPRQISINQKPGKTFPQIKIKENQKQQVLSPVESPICWPDKSILRTRSISLVSEDNLATNEQLSLSFSKYIRFTNKCYEGVDPTLDPNAYLRSQCFRCINNPSSQQGPFCHKKVSSFVDLQSQTRKYQ